MEAAEILRELHKRGASLHTLDGGRLQVVPASVLDDGLSDAIRAHKPDLIAALNRSLAVVEEEPSPFDQLQLDWRSAIERARAAFRENDIVPDLDQLEAAARLEFKAVEWRRMAGAGIEEAQHRLELLAGVYAGRMTATAGVDGKVAIRAKEGAS